MTKARSSADFAAGGPNVAGKNTIINGGMDIWQRGTSFTAADVYTTDRWKKDSQTYSTISRQTTSDTTNLPTIQYCTRVQRNSGQTGTGGLGIIYSAETADSIKLAGQPVVVSFYARAGANYSSASSALSYNFYTGTGTDQSRSFGVQFTGEANIGSSSRTLTTTWQRFSFTATVGATATELALMFLFNGVGTAGANDYFEITGVQLELGSSATPFSRAGGTIQGELAACQRYCINLNSANNSDVYFVFANGYVSSSTTLQGFNYLPVTMRVAPSATISTTANQYAIIAGAGGVSTCNAAPTLQRASTTTVWIVGTVSSGLTAGNAGVLVSNATNSPTIILSAEL
jgi:hypothetical protein